MEHKSPLYSELILEHLQVANRYVWQYGKYLQEKNMLQKYQYCTFLEKVLKDAIDNVSNHLSTADIYSVVYTFTSTSTSKFHMDEKFFTTKERAEEWAKDYIASFIIPPTYTINLCTVIIDKESNALTILTPKLYKRITHDMIDMHYKRM